MIRRLIILLLIVGCAPTTATFYIGMTEKEFNKEKPDLDKHAIKRSMFGSAAMILVDPEENKDLPYFYIERKGQIGLITWLTFGKINSYYYIFDPEADTLTSMEYGNGDSFYEINKPN